MATALNMKEVWHWEKRERLSSGCQLGSSSANTKYLFAEYLLSTFKQTLSKVKILKILSERKKGRSEMKIKIDWFWVKKIGYSKRWFYDVDFYQKYNICRVFIEQNSDKEFFLEIQTISCFKTSQRLSAQFLSVFFNECSIITTTGSFRVD